MLDNRILATRKRLAFEDEPRTVKKMCGLITPPASPEKAVNIRSVPLSVSPKRLNFGPLSIYSRTKALLQRCANVEIGDEAYLPTRMEQYTEIMGFLKRVIDSDSGDSVYITGPPGTGKTAQVDLIIREKFQMLALGGPQLKHEAGLSNTFFFETSTSEFKSVAIASINCIAINNPESIFAKIYESFASDASEQVRSAEDLQKFILSHPNTTFIVILDEMDKLVTSTLQDANATKHIFDLFLLAKLPKVKFGLISIANSLDMKDRFLSRLNLKRELLPKTITFPPYTAEQMYDIVMQKLTAAGNELVIQPAAIRFAAKKCSGNTGDLRKLFDVLRSSIEVVELAAIKNRHSSDGHVTKVTLAHVAKVFSTFMNNSSTKSRLSKLNMQQRLVLGSLVHREKFDIFQTQCSMDDAYDYYTKLLDQKNAISPLKRNEFLEICNALETCGVVHLAQGKSFGKTRHLVKFIKSNVDKREFDDEVGKLALLKEILG